MPGHQRLTRQATPGPISTSADGCYFNHFFMPRALAQAMDLRRVSVVLGLVLATAGAAHAASDTKAKKYFIPPAPKAKAAGLKPATATVAVSTGLRTGGPSLSISTLSPTTSTLSRGLTGLPQVGDAAPICRAQCAQSRYICLTVDDEVCDTQWARCVAGCGGS